LECGSSAADFLGRVAAPEFSPAFQGREYRKIKNKMRRVATLDQNLQFISIQMVEVSRR
jgi:hypothetical protein